MTIDKTDPLEWKYIVSETEIVRLVNGLYCLVDKENNGCDGCSCCEPDNREVDPEELFEKELQLMKYERPLHSWEKNALHKIIHG